MSKILPNTAVTANCLDMMSNMPPVDIIITDPPYGVGFNYDGYSDTFEEWKELISKFIPLACSISKTSVIFPVGSIGGEKFLHRNFDPLWRICWYKGASPIRSYIGWQDFEILMVFGNKPKKSMHDFFAAYPLRPNMEAIYLNHPCPKPLEWSMWLIEKSTEVGDLVFDPFCGSGTTLVSAKELGRNYLGCDISEKYVNIAKNALEMTETKMIRKREDPKMVPLF